MWPSRESRTISFGFITICLVLRFVMAHDSAIHLVLFSEGDPRVRIPCLCLRDVKPESVKIVTWNVTKVNSNMPLVNGTVPEAMHPENMSDPGGVTQKYTLGEGLSLVVDSPELTDSARYRCEIVLMSNRTLSSTVELTMHDNQQPASGSGIRHYIIPAIVVLVLFIELAFLFALWLNLRIRNPDSPGNLSSVGIFSSFQVSPRAWYTDVEKSPTPPWNGNQSSEHRLLMEDLNDGSIFERDSGFDDKMSVTTSSRDPQDDKWLEGMECMGQVKPQS